MAKKEISKVQPRFQKTDLSDDQLEELDSKFYYDRKLQPEDMDYEWKRFSVLGKEDRQHQNMLKRRGWTAVPGSRHPETAGEGSGDEEIIIEGQILMERDIRISERARMKILSETNQGQKDHFERLKLTTPTSALKYSRSFEQAIPE